MDDADAQGEGALVEAAAAQLGARFGAAPAVAVVLGSGLGAVVDALTEGLSVPYAELGLPASAVAGHAGALVVGRLAGHRVAVFAGRVHLYEGRSPAEVVRYVRAARRWGVRGLLVTNAVGGIGEGFEPGTLAIVTDHLNLQGRSPLVGAAHGVRFPDLSRAYDAELRRVLAESAAAAGADARPGVLAAMLGPAYETPAEIRMLARLGADVVGMSAVPEVLAAAELGLRCAVLSLVANRAAGLSAAPLTHEEVVAEIGRASARVADLLRRALPAMVSVVAQE